MSDFVSRPNVSLNKWLADQHYHVIRDLSATLDLETALREITIPARHANLVADLGGVLDIEAGLRAIVPIGPDPTPYQPESTTALYAGAGSPLAARDRYETDRKQVPPDPMSLTDLEELVRAVASRRPGTRLAMRNHPVFALARDLARDCAFTRGLGLYLAAYLDRDLALHLDCDLTVDRDLALGRDHTRAVDLVCALNRARDQIRTIGSNRALYRVLYRVLDLDHTRAVDLVRALDRACARDLDLTRARDLEHIGDLVRALHRDLDRTSRLLTDLYHALNDFTGADLRTVNLAGIPLDGMRWSSATQWPPQWVEQVWLNSVPVGKKLSVSVNDKLKLYEVRGRNRDVTGAELGAATRDIGTQFTGSHGPRPF